MQAMLAMSLHGKPMLLLLLLFAGDQVVYSVQLINSGNVHLKSVNLYPVTNSSTNGINTTFPLDCGVAGTLPRQILVSDMFTCTRTIDFTTPVGRACKSCCTLCTCNFVLRAWSWMHPVAVLCIKCISDSVWQRKCPAQVCVCSTDCRTKLWLLPCLAGHPCW